MGFNFVLCVVLLSFAYFTAGVQAGEYLGCFRDNQSRILPDVWLIDHRSNSPSTCAHICGRLGFKLAGVQSTYECFCGNVIPSTKIDEDQCNKPCPQDSSLKCGGDLANSVYRTDDQTKAVQAGEYLGCFRDTPSRTLPEILLYNPRDNSPSTCKHLCWRLGYKLAGVQYSDHCSCGNVLPSTKIDEDQCNSTCPQNSSLKCGGGWANSVYVTEDLKTPQERVCTVFMDSNDLNVVTVNDNSCQYRCTHKINKKGITIFKKDGDKCNNDNGICVKGVCQETNAACPKGFYGVRNLCKIFCYSFENQGMAVVRSIQEGAICIDEHDSGICVNGKCVIT